jgi:cysteine desulfurase/selenocysteine lyase
MTSWDLAEQQRLRAEFPQLCDATTGSLIYLDTAATALKPKAVIDTLQQFLSQEYATVNRALYGLSQRATTRLFTTRQLVARLVGAADPNQVIFTRGTTDSINLVAQAMSQGLRPGDEIVVTAQEHHSNLVPWQMACQRSGATLRVLPLLPSGEWDLEALNTIVTSRCRLVACAAVSNVLGAWNPVEPLVAAAKNAGALVLLDCAQAVGSHPVSLEALGVDFLAFSAHKLYGPTGLGALVGTIDALESLPPVQGGGDMIDQVGLFSSTYAPLPHRLEAGTPAVAEIVAWAPALQMLMDLTPEAIGRHTMQLRQVCMKGMESLGFQVFLPCARSRTLCSGIHPDWHASDLAQLLSCRGISVRSGHLCAQPLLKHLGHSHVLRASFGIYNTSADVTAFLDNLADLVQ